MELEDLHSPSSCPGGPFLLVPPPLSWPTPRGLCHSLSVLCLSRGVGDGPLIILFPPRSSCPRPCNHFFINSP